MRTKEIVLAGATTADEVLDVARSTLEERGYLWVRTGGSSAEAHEGGEEIKKRSARKLLVGVHVAGANLVLEQKSNGSSGYRFGMLGVTIQQRVGGEFKKAWRTVEQSLRRDGLA